MMSAIPAESGAACTHPADVHQLLFQGLEAQWEMMPVERCALILLMQELKPECAIEIGTRMGGSTSVFSRYCKKVYTLDIDPTCPERLAHRFPNVEFVTGNSHETLPPLLQCLADTNNEPQLILVDGDHTPAGARLDIDNALALRPQRPVCIVMHDSFNPDCREGIATANWAGNPHVHAVDLDFVPGIYSSNPSSFRQMWGGFAVAWLLPQPRQHELVVGATYDFAFQTLAVQSVHRAIAKPAVPPAPPEEPATVSVERPSLARRAWNRCTSLRRAG